VKFALPIFIASLGVVTLAGCVTYQTTLINAQGQTITCEARGKSGIVTGYSGFEDCVAAAKAQGFKEVPYYQPEIEAGKLNRR
jgi:hypothetical protein